MKKGQKAPALEPSPQIGVRISPQERMLLGRLIAAAERKADLAPGTLTPASYARSALLAYMAQAVAELEADGDAPGKKGPNRWERLRENVAQMGEESKARK
jgi:hypothetical protein